ncbi:uroporphyrinogen decarboxylase family protein [Eubacteriaceae bacterium ES3]|nr:uroporphyrinogen decarboxylase family protein [Eubacteriaceae bacterium ES3]
MEDLNNLFDQRITRMSNAVEHKENDRVPMLNLMETWALSYNNVTIPQVLDNPELEYESYAKVFSEFETDAALGIGLSSPIKFNNALGGSIMNIETGTMQVHTSQSELMKAEEYDDFIKDPMQFITNVILPRKIEIFKSGTIEEKFGKMGNAIGEMGNYGKQAGMFKHRLKTEYGFPALYGTASLMPGDYFLDYLRDFKGTMTDVKRNPDKLAEACMAMVEPCIKSTLAMSPTPSDESYLSLFLHLPQFLRPKEFEKIYWPSFKAYIEFFASRGYKFLIMFEKNWMHLYEYLQELPKNCILGLFEEDDLVKAKNAIGDTICIGGGIKTNDLYFKSPEECIDNVKRVIDEVAPGGGFVLTTDKSLLSPTDAKPENYKAVTDYIKNNSNY